jgi:outer membrane PBP1 activator LpoA protein
VIVIASDTPLQKRFASAFNAEWILAGGAEPTLVRFERAPEALAQLRRDLARAPPDVALLALDGGDAVLVKPYLGVIPAYAGSQVNDRQPREMQRELNGLRFIDIPWLGEADAAALPGSARPRQANATLDRLYALGMDAFRVAQAFVDGPPVRLDISGATGRITLDESRQLVRQGRLFQFRAGDIVSVDSR